jgi:membrane protein implicated in regulation of membrane protease activity
VKAVSVPLTPWKVQVLGAALQLVLLLLLLRRWQSSPTG